MFFSLKLKKRYGVIPITRKEYFSSDNFIPYKIYKLNCAGHANDKLFIPNSQLNVMTVVVQW